MKAALTKEVLGLEERLRVIEMEALSDPGKWQDHRKVQKELHQVYFNLGNFDYIIIPPSATRGGGQAG